MTVTEMLRDRVGKPPDQRAHCSASSIRVSRQQRVFRLWRVGKRFAVAHRYIRSQSDPPDGRRDSSYALSSTPVVLVRQHTKHPNACDDCECHDTLLHSCTVRRCDAYWQCVTGTSRSSSCCGRGSLESEQEPIDERFRHVDSSEAFHGRIASGWSTSHTATSSTTFSRSLAQHRVLHTCPGRYTSTGRPTATAFSGSKPTSGQREHCHAALCRCNSLSNRDGDRES